jgi:sec-independent protein translocase protein TatA
MPNVGPGEIVLLLLLALLLFGANRLPEIGRSLGRGMREFKDSISGSERVDAPLEPVSLGSGEDHPPTGDTVQHERRFCSGCGAEARPEDRFCSRCGASLEPPALTVQ